MKKNIMLNNTFRNNYFPRNKLLIYTWGIIAIWILILAGLLTLDLTSLRKSSEELAIREARAHFLKDEAFRFWASTHGGFYVPVDERTQPNPNLAHITERDIETPSGKQLTLMNPAWALRQMNEDFSETYGVAGHITSLKPLRPMNAPDDWERDALESFENGEIEKTEFTKYNGQFALRLMRPLVTQIGCLKCHEKQGYKIGDVRGGVSVTVFFTSYMKKEKDTAKTIILSYFLILLLGLFLIIMSSRIILKNKLEREHSQKMLLESNNMLENRVMERTAELEKGNKKLHVEIIQREKIEIELNNHKEQLEKLVLERTKKLEVKNIELIKKYQDLEKYHELFVGREFRVKELKEKIVALEKQIDNLK